MQGFLDWLKHPYRDDMSALHWFYFMGLLAIIAAAWGIILNRVAKLEA